MRDMNDESRYFTAEELLEHLGHIIHDEQLVEPGAALYARKVDFTRLAKTWLKENFGRIRDTVCQSEYRAYMDHDLILYAVGLLQPVFSPSIAVPLAYYLCKVGLRSLCEEPGAEFVDKK
jgi:hypothetical protein